MILNCGHHARVGRLCISPPLWGLLILIAQALRRQTVISGLRLRSSWVVRLVTDVTRRPTVAAVDRGPRMSGCRRRPAALNARLPTPEVEPIRSLLPSTQILITLSLRDAAHRRQQKWTPRCRFLMLPVLHCVRGKRDQNVFCNIFYKLRRLWWKLVHGFPNKFAAKSYKHFRPHLYNVFTLPCEIWNACRVCATIELLKKDALEIIPLLLWHPNSPDLNRFDYSVCGILQENVHKTCITDLGRNRRGSRARYNRS